MQLIILVNKKFLLGAEKKKIRLKYLDEVYI